MILISRHDEVVKRMTKGCPQGSIIGPLAWNWAMDDLLNKLEMLEHRNAYATAYADDLALLVCENSRVAIETSATKATEIIQDWCALYKLQIAIKKRLYSSKAAFIGKECHESMYMIEKLNLQASIDTSAYTSIEISALFRTYSI